MFCNRKWSKKGKEVSISFPRATNCSIFQISELSECNKLVLWGFMYGLFVCLFVLAALCLSNLYFFPQVIQCGSLIFQGEATIDYTWRARLKGNEI